MAYSIGAKIQLEGEKEYKQQIKSIGLSNTELLSQMKKLTAEFADNAESVEFLTKKSELLNDQNEKNQEKIEKINQRLKASNELYEKNAEAIENAKEKLKQAEATQKEMAATMSETDEEMKNQNKTVKEMQEAVEEAETAQLKLADSMTRLRTQLNDAETAAIKTEREIRNVATALEESSDEGDAFGESVKDSFGSAGDVVGGFGGKLLDIMENFSKARESGVTASEAMTAAVAGGLVPAVVDLIGQLKEAQEEYDKMKMEAEESLTKAKLSLGLTEEETEILSKGIEKIYAGGIVESREEAAEAMTTVYRLLGETGEQAEHTAENVIALKEVFGVDYAETVKTASTIMKTFGTDSETAFNLITNGLQSSANKSGDLLDVLGEQAISFERLGYSAEEFLSGLIASADAGAYSVAAAADSIKEFYVRAVESSDAYKEALEDLGLNSEKLTDQIVKGGDEGEKAMQTVLEKLKGVSNETKQARIAAELFGGRWEDVGTEAILAFSESSKSAKKFTTETIDLVDELGETTETWSKKIERFFEALGSGLVDSLLGPVATITSLKTSLAELFSGLDKLGNGSSSVIGRGLATGTPSATPGIHPVAEKGAELITSPTFRSFKGGERVYNAGETQQILQSAANGTTVYNLYITADISQLDDVKQLVENAKRQQLNARSR